MRTIAEEKEKIECQRKEKEMEIIIYGYWNAGFKPTPPPNENIDEKLNRGENIRICDIKINGKLLGGVMWNGKTLWIKPP
ncbi:MAG: hypothetical protein ABSB71_08885 [Candidatus Bathyarchaeia archaeon]|jgi:hypothetical protein